ncbi:MAG: hypothetical protein DA407_11570 [Bacteroidetes bacterium]|nr:MAG: hypothetical protein DA407_11570 [Bacteroidota bacterium]
MTANNIFVSYSSRDVEFAKALAEELEKLGSTVWIDQHGIGLGTNWDSSIDEALDSATTLLLLISKPAAKSENVQDEVHIAKEDGKKLIPILIEQCELPMRWKRMQYADFTASPNIAMEKVLKALDIDLSEISKFVNLKTKLVTVKTESEAILDEVLKETEAKINQEKLIDLMVSEEEIDKVTLLHTKARIKEWQTAGLVALLVIALFFIMKTILGLTLSINTENILQDRNSLYLLIVLIGSGLCLFLAYKPYAKAQRRTRNIALLDLFKVKRQRLIRIINKMSTKEIEEINNEFDSLISI